MDVLSDATIFDKPDFVADPVEARDWAGRTRLNSLQPISRLPDDVLSLIFLASALDTRPRSFITQRAEGLVVRKLGSGWLDVTQVCRVWRHVALAYPVLWSCDTLPMKLGQSWVQEFLARSGSTTLKVLLTLADLKSSKSLTWVRDLIHDHIYRVGELAIRGNESLFGVLDNLEKEAPRLTSIFFVSSHPLTPSTGVQCLLNAPMLRTIKLVSVSCNLSQHSWPNLRNLTIKHAPIEAMQALKVFYTAPLLESAILSPIIPSYTQFQKFEPIELRNLYQFDVQGEALSVLELWRNLAQPPSARLFLTMNGDSDHRLTMDNAMSILQLIQKHLLSVEDNGRALMKYKFSVTYVVTIAAFPDYDRDDPFQSTIHASIFQLSMRHSLLPREIGMPELMRALPLASCEVLDIEAGYSEVLGRYLWSVQAWSAIIAETARVETLRVSGYGANTLVKAAVAGLEREERITLFPSLQRLYLYRTPFRGPHYDLKKDDTPSFCTDLVSWLSLRKSYAVTSIGKLIVRKCDLYAEWLTPFYQVEGLVVDWDSDLGEIWAESQGFNLSLAGPSTVPDDA